MLKVLTDILVGIIKVNEYKWGNCLNMSSASIVIVYAEDVSGESTIITVYNLGPPSSYCASK